MKDDLVRVYRPSSPRTGRKSDMRWVPQKQLKKHLAAGWKLSIEKVESKPVVVESKPVVIEEKKLSLKDLSEDILSKIKNDNRPMLELAKIYNTSYHAIRKIKGRT